MGHFEYTENETQIVNLKFNIGGFQNGEKYSF